MNERQCVICSATLEKNQTKLCGSSDCKSVYNKERQRKYRQRRNRELRNGIALQSNNQDEHETIKNPPVRYKGGKWRLADWIIGHFPKHVSYVEPFCGGASIFFQKKPSAIETLNDLNKNIVTFFDMLRAKPEELIRSIELTPYSRDEWDKAHDLVSDNPLDIARAFYIRSRMSFDSGEGRWKSGWRYMKRDTRGKAITAEWNDVSMLWGAAKRLKDAQIECADAL
ncbi:MAG: DNA adenine methylase, partial [Chloroflexota bacterium]